MRKLEIQGGDCKLFDQSGEEIHGFEIVTDDFSLRKIMGYLERGKVANVYLYRGRGLALAEYRNAVEGILTMGGDGEFCFSYGNSIIRFGLAQLSGVSRDTCLFFEEELVDSIEDVKTGDQAGKDDFYPMAYQALTGEDPFSFGVQAAVEKVAKSLHGSFSAIVEGTDDRSFQWLTLGEDPILNIYIPMKDFEAQGVLRVGADFRLDDEEEIFQFLGVVHQEYPIQAENLYQLSDSGCIHVSVGRQMEVGEQPRVIIVIEPVYEEE